MARTQWLWRSCCTNPEIVVSFQMLCSHCEGAMIHVAYLIYYNGEVIRTMEHTNPSTVVARTQISHRYRNHHDCHDVSRHVIIFARRWRWFQFFASLVYFCEALTAHKTTPSLPAWYLIFGVLSLTFQTLQGWEYHIPWFFPCGKLSWLSTLNWRLSFIFFKFLADIRKRAKARILLSPDSRREYLLWHSRPSWTRSYNAT